MRLLLVLLLTLATACAEPSPKRVLFVGNSYTAGIQKALTGFLNASPHKDAKLEFITPGGRTLEQHLATPKTMARIAGGGWEIVVLQDQSQTPAVFPEKFLASSAKLHAAVTKAGARTVYYETWGRRDGDPQNAERFPTYEAMQSALSTSYRAAAKRDHATLAPVGAAWQQVRRDRPALGTALYAADGSHPAAPGALLAAACLYKAIFKADPATVPFDGGLPAEDADYLRKTAAGIPAPAAP